MSRSTLLLPLQGLDVSLRAETFDDNTGTVDLVWSTGAPVQRYSHRDGAYVETLDMTPQAVRLDRMNAGAPFLNTHSSYQLGDIIGSVVPGSAKVEGGKGTASVKLSSDPAHAGIRNNVRDGVIRNVSVGYRAHAIVKTEGDNGQPAQWRVTDWEPFEISAVPIPADPGAQMRSGAPGPGEVFPCAVSLAEPDPVRAIEAARARLRMAARSAGLPIPR